MSYKHFTKYDRIRLDAYIKAGFTYRRVALLLGFSIGAISYEIRLNGGKNRYDASFANKRAKKVRGSANQCHRKIGKDGWLTDEVLRLLRKHWTPEQIVGRLKGEMGIRPTSVTAIYDWCNSDKELYSLLPRKHNKYRRTKEGNIRKKQREEESRMKSINTRPKYIEKRKSLGHWEGDTIIGKERTARILTHVERRSGYLLADILYDVTANRVRDKTVCAFSGIEEGKRKTITYDRGTEFADWELTERELESDIYFANAYHSWERGTNENTNGLIRRYYPKKTIFGRIKRKELKEVVEEINYRPRKRLGYKTPYEVFHGVQLRTLM